jgi:hypothetical protein
MKEQPSLSDGQDVTDNGTENIIQPETMNDDGQMKVNEPVSADISEATEPEPQEPENIVKENDPALSPIETPQPHSEESVATPENVPVTVPKPSRRPKHLRLILLITLAVLLAAGLATSYWYYFIKKTTQVTSIVTDESDDVGVDDTAPMDVAASQNVQSAELKVQIRNFTQPTTGEVWYKTPKEITSLDLYKSDSLSYYKGTVSDSTAEELWKQGMTKYYEVGTHAGNTIIMADTARSEMGEHTELFEKASDGTISFIVNPQHRGRNYTEVNDALKAPYTSKVKSYNLTTYYDSLTIPSELTLSNGEVVKLPDDSMYLGTISSSDDAVISTDTTYGGSAVQRLSKTYADTHLTNIGYGVRLPIGTLVYVNYAPFGATLEGATFTNGATTKTITDEKQASYESIYAVARGCGSFSPAATIADSLTLGDLTAIGKTAGGNIIYEPTVKTTGLYQKAYDEYAAMNDKYAKSKDQYIHDHGLLLIQNKSNKLLVYVRSSYSAAGGCAKPVVYLYPAKSTFVSVKVGASVTVSDPIYPKSGWQNVWAEPNGKLTYLGKSYDSLFWEGQGYGEYPGIASGTVVKRADAAKTMRTQLAAQGLNSKEIGDFMAFWEAKIPNKPYIRLTWLSTNQMNALAPLTVSPKPQTVIRVFLDMDGFDTPIKLPTQKLTKVERKGFTVVEWGGLTSLVRH